MTENAFTNLSRPLVERSERLSLWLIRRLRSIALRLVSDPDVVVSLVSESRAVTSQHESFLDEATDWIDEALPTSYLRGIEQGNRSGRESGNPISAGRFAEAGILAPSGPPSPISPKARELLADYPQHFTMYEVFQGAAYRDFEATRIPIVREQEDRIRRLSVQASESAYRDADTFTRREMSGQLMTQFADEGITGIRYSNGRTMKLDSYSEMVARTQTGNAARQANMNRLQEYGMDLVQISQHFPTSDLCEPYQGRVFSISGRSDRFPSLQDAIAGGLYHANCMHSQAGYTPGINKLPDEDMAVRENRDQYEAKQEQRYNERQVKAWKRREAAAMTEAEQVKAKAKVRQWQARQRDHIKSNEFLRRDYSREQI